MTVEIERRWIVDEVPSEALLYPASDIVQSYLDSGLRLRKMSMNGYRYYLTVKSAVTQMTNKEVEVEVPVEIYESILPFASRYLTKTRREIKHDNLTIELDTFDNGLSIAEIELPSEDYDFEVPSWFGKEVTGDRTLSNYSLSKTIDNKPQCGKTE